MEILLKLSRVTLNLSGSGNIGYNFNYEVMKWLYKAIEEVDNTYAMNLHETGVIVDNKKFKLFNFNLQFDKCEFREKDIIIDDNSTCKLMISGKSETINYILKGLLKLQSITIDGVPFKIGMFELDKNIRFEKIMLYRVRTPIVTSIYEDGVKFINVMDNRFYSILGQNLIRKYKAFYNEDYEGDLFFEIENLLDVKRKFITNIKDKGFVEGYTDFAIYIEAEPKMQKIAYHLGLGQNNSLGMGSISYIMGRKW